MDIAEIFSPPRFTTMAENYGLKPGFAVDLETGWDLTKKTDVFTLKHKVQLDDPMLLTGSPCCDQFSALQNLRKEVTEERLARRAEGRKKLKTACEFYKEQVRRKRYFLHEHPWGASSWNEKCVKEVQALPGVQVVKGAMCHWHMTSEDSTGRGLVKKPTGWMTNSSELAEILSASCSNKDGSGKPWHRHVMLVNGRARHAKVYPPEIVKAVLKGLRKQLEVDGVFNAGSNSR